MMAMPSSARMARRAAVVFAAASAALALATALRLPAAWESGNALNHVSGVWLTLADDLARGTLYRPLHAPGGGYGGTRYFPLAFALEGGLVRMGVPLLAAGYAASLAAGLLLVVGAFLLLRALGIPLRRAAAFAPLGLAGFAGQLARAVRAGEDDPRLVPALWLGAAWAGALAVLATPGTGVNHLLELEAASAALLGVSAAARGRAGALARAGAPAAALAGVVVALALWRADMSSSRLAELREVVRALPAGEPVLSEDPLVPLLAGERPYLLDPFTIRLTEARAPELCAPLAEALRHGGFRAVVLFEDLDSPAAAFWYADGNLGLPLAGEIRRGYRRAAAIGRYHLYLPRVETAAGVVRRGGPG